MKIALITCNTGDNVNFKPLLHKEKEIDYIYITDNKDFYNESKSPDFKSGGYKFLYSENNYQDDEVCSKSRKLAKRIKIMHKEFVSKYDWIIWLDGHKQIGERIKTFKNYISEIPNNIDIVFKPHPDRSNVFDEIEACEKIGCEKIENTKKWEEKLLQEGFNEIEHTLIETNIIFFRCKHKNIPHKFYADWWEYSTNFLRRDQLTLNYFIWKFKIEKYIKIDRDIPRIFQFLEVGKTARGHKEWLNEDKQKQPESSVRELQLCFNKCLAEAFEKGLQQGYHTGFLHGQNIAEKKSNEERQDITTVNT